MGTRTCCPSRTKCPCNVRNWLRPMNARGTPYCGILYCPASEPAHHGSQEPAVWRAQQGCVEGKPTALIEGLAYRLHSCSASAAHGKCVTAIAADRAGARLLTGGEDYQLQMFDFGGMKRDMRSFRKLEPMEGYPINALSFSPSGALPSGTCVQQRLSESGSLCGALQSCAWRDAGLAMQPADSRGAHLPGCIVGDTAAQGYGKALATKSTVISTDCILGRRCLLSRAGDAFLVVSGSSQPKVYDRDGHELGELPKGDMYIRDATHTKGHQYRCCGGAWHPDERCAFQLHPTCDGVLSQCCCQKFDMSCGQMRQHRHCKGWTFYTGMRPASNIG